MLFNLSNVTAPGFAHFIFDTGQDEALRIAKEVAGGTASAYLWGPAGTGKTHLLDACGQVAQDAGRTLSRLDGALPERGLVLCDDVTDYDASSQDLLFAVLKQALQNSGIQVLATGLLPPAKLGNLRPDVRNRLEELPCIRLRPLSDSGRQAALLSYANRCGRALDAGVAKTLVERLPRDMGNLVDAYRQLDAHAVATDTKLTTAVAGAWLRARHDG